MGGPGRLRVILEWWSGIDFVSAYTVSIEFGLTSSPVWIVDLGRELSSAFAYY